MNTETLLDNVSSTGIRGEGMSERNETWLETFQSWLAGEGTGLNPGGKLLNGSRFDIKERWSDLNGFLFNVNCPQNTSSESLNFTVLDNTCDARGDISVNNILTVAAGVVFALFVINAFIAVCMNASVLYALFRVKSLTLKAKVYIQNNTIANLLLPLVSCIDMPFLIGHGASVTLQICAGGVYFLAFSITSFVQTLSVFGLALDRIYAIAIPLRYGTIGYSRWQKALLVVSPWLSAVVIWGCFLAHSLQHLPPTPDGIPDVCFIVMSTFDMMWKIRVIDVFFLSFHFLSFMIYMVVFICFKCHQGSIQNVPDTHAKQTTLSLAIVYFMVNLTTLCLYLPVPIYSMTYQHMMKNPNERGEFILTMRSLQCLYFFNSTLNPILLMVRVRSIRENLPLKYCLNVS